MIEWGTVDEGIEGKFRPSLVKTARRRLDSTHRSTNGWIVVGNDKMSDAYPFYEVKQGSNGYLHCSCQQHSGGEYRKVCSHIVAVLLKREDQGFQAAQDGPPLLSPGHPGSEEGGGRRSDSPPSSPPTHPGEEMVAGATIDSGMVADQSTIDSATIPTDPDDPEWGSEPLPGWVTEFRPHQIMAVEDIVDAFDRGTKVVMVDAPTGSGKTLIAEMVRRMRGAAGLYTCTTKTLQDQVKEDFEYMALLKGRENYPTELAPYPDVTAADCGGSDGCNWCSDRSVCEYLHARDRALGADMTILNSAYLLTAWNGPRMFRGRGLVVVDECDLIESTLMGFVEVRISSHMRKKYGIGAPNVKTHTAKSAPEDWLSWVDSTLPRLRMVREGLDGRSDNVKEVREAKRIDGLLGRMSILRKGLVDSEEEGMRWVYDQDKYGNVVFKPVKVDEFGQGMIWQHGQRFLLMSASIVSSEEVADSLGLGNDEWEVVKVDSTFPKDRRPVHVIGMGRVTNKTHDDVVGKIGDAVKGIADKHDGERMLVHTVSYRMANDLYEHLMQVGMRREVMQYRSAAERENVLKWMKGTENSMVLAPSFDRGVDLTGDLCRVQVIAKVPYPNLGDKQVNARLRTGWAGQVWYNVQTARTLIQMTGRAMRSEDDWCVSYIIDSQFIEFWKRNKSMFPQWWKEAVDTTGRVRSLIV